MPTDDLFLEGARLGPRSPVLVEHDEAPRRARLPRMFGAYSLVDLAHAVMLTEEGILPRARGGALLAALLDIHRQGPEGFPWDPQSGSYLVQVEHVLARRVGDDVAGRLQTGRSRNDQDAAADRLLLRDLLLSLLADLGALQGTLLRQARTHADTVMPGYTHLQHAQPWVFGHYLMRVASGLERDLQRLRAAYARTNLSALGGAANAGTSWPLDRRRVADLLGHDGLVWNSSDAGLFARDFVEEDVAVLAILMGNLGHLATDLYLWSSWEFGFVEVADGLAGTSSIMPQKKNPHAVERVKALAGQAIGWLPAVMGCQRGVSSTDLDLVFGDNLLIPIGDAVTSALRLMTAVVDTLVVRTDVMAARAGANWSTASHLADELVRRHDLPFRTAHHVVARLARAAIAGGRGPGDVTGEALAEAARATGVTGVALSTPELRQILDARAFVESRVTEGSVNPARVREHVARAETALAEHRAWLSTTRDRVAGATERLLEAATRLAAPAPSP